MFARRMQTLFRNYTVAAVDKSRKCLADGSVIVTHSVPSSAPRLSPTSFISVGSTALEQDGGGFSSISNRLCSEAAAQGFPAYHFDLAFDSKELQTSKLIVDHLAQSLKSLIHSTESSFRPILYSQSLGCLIAQTFVSSHPVSALILDSPPFNNAALASWPGLPQRFPLPLPEFTFEPRFPVLVLERRSAQGALQHCRLVTEGADYAEVCESKSVNVGNTREGEEAGDGDIPDRSRAVWQWIDELGL